MDFSKKDDVITIPLPGSDLVFTQYLYIKEEVRFALLVSILNKSNDAIFWAYELYHSGFKYELLNLIWKIYYDFFATLNPAYEAYLLKKHKEFVTCLDPDERVISSIIQDLLFRPFNNDVFMLRNICENFEVDITYHHGTEKITHIDEARHNLIQWIAKEDFRSIAQWILNLNKDVIKVVDIYNISLDIFDKEFKLITCKQKSKLQKEFVSSLRLNMNTNVVLLAKIIQLFSRKAELKKGRSIYINVEPEDIIPYEPIIGSNEIKHYSILEKAYMCGIDDLKHLSLFKLTRNKYNIQEEYWYRWEYHASFSPLWSKRIREFGGYLDYTKQKVIFKEEPDDDLMQEFYGLYGLEPDEQRLDTQNKSIQSIEKIHNWTWFNDQYKKNGLFYVYEEELEEFDNDGLTY
jgi:hypothetical protein